MKDIFRLLLLSCLFVFVSGSRAQTLRWEMLTAFTTRSNLNAVASGNGVFVAGGKGMLIYSSDGGTNWAPAADTGSTELKAIAFGNSRFVAVGLSGAIYTSTNGSTWTSVTLPTSSVFYGAVFGAGRFVIVGTNGAIYSSADGVNWDQSDTGTTGTLSFAAFGNGTFLILENRAPQNALTFLKSPDGVNWTRINTSAPARPVSYPCTPQPNQPECTPAYTAGDLTFGNGVFISAMTGYTLPPNFWADKWYMKSTDGVTWQWADPQEKIGWTGNLISAPPQNTLFFVNGNYVQTYLPAAPQIWVSSDAVTWQGILLNNDPTSGLVSAIAGDGANIVAVGGFPNGPGSSIERGTSFTGLHLYAPTVLPRVDSVASNPSSVVAVGPSGLLARSTDGGHNFTKLTLPDTASDLKKVSFAANNFVGVGVGGTIVRSAAGDTWTKRLSNTVNDLYDVVYGSNLWVAVGLNGTIVYSTDSSFFTLANSGTQVPLRGVAYGNGRYVAVGNDGAVLSSTDGITWSARGTDEAKTLYGVAFGNGKFVAVGSSGAVHTSVDGLSWQYSPISGAGTLLRVAFAGGNFVAIESNTARAYVSTDGSSWTATSLLGSLTGADSSGGALYVSNADGTIWKSAIQVLTGPTLRGTINSNRQFVLIIDVPQPGDFRILTSTNLLGPWQDGDLLDVSAHAEWTSPAQVSGKLFYRLRQE